MSCPRCKGFVVVQYDSLGSLEFKQPCYYQNCVNCGWVLYSKLQEKVTNVLTLTKEAV